jgi:hypothetical protein
MESLRELSKIFQVDTEFEIKTENIKIPIKERGKM